jgi:hypothetical protein
VSERWCLPVYNDPATRFFVTSPKITADVHLRREHLLGVKNGVRRRGGLQRREVKFHGYFEIGGETKLLVLYEARPYLCRVCLLGYFTNPQDRGHLDVCAASQQSQVKSCLPSIAGRITRQDTLHLGHLLREVLGLVCPVQACQCEDCVPEREEGGMCVWERE